MNEYRSEKWHEFREEVLRLDDYTCKHCGRPQSEGVQLHVHHKRYLPGRKPWEYPHDMCETLCSGCHAIEHGIIPPKFGWIVVGYDDLGDLCGECDYCGTPLRHSFLVSHERWHALEVGEMCCDKLTGTREAMTHLNSMQRYTERRKRFVSSSRWTQNKFGGQSIKHNGIHLVLIRLGDAYHIRINGSTGKLEFATLVDGKAKAFDLIESGKIDVWLRKQGKIPGER